MLLWTGQRGIAIAATLLALSTLLAACARESAGPSERWRVQHYKKPCMGEGPRLCYLIDRGKGDFEYFYDEIEGWEYRWGYSYQIEVTRSTQPAVADASTLQYRLADVIEQQRAPVDTTFTLPLSLDGQVLIAANEGACTLLAAIDIETTAGGCDALRNQETAVFRHHASEQKLVLVLSLTTPGDASQRP
jgi:hypothetical protein